MVNQSPVTERHLHIYADALGLAREKVTWDNLAQLTGCSAVELRTTPYPSDRPSGYIEGWCVGRLYDSQYNRGLIKPRRGHIFWWLGLYKGYSFLYRSATKEQK